jgi:hypothetical protein
VEKAGASVDGGAHDMSTRRISTENISTENISTEKISTENTPTQNGSSGPPFEGVAGRGAVDYLLRNTNQALIAFTGQADLKASIMITACSITISVALTHHAKDAWVGSLVVLVGFSVVALILSVVTVLPKHRSPAVTSQEFNPLFFGHFVHVSKEDYLDAIGTACRDDEELYRIIAADIYELGRYLERYKYRYLRLSYLSFLVGIIAGCLLEGAYLILR